MPALNKPSILFVLLNVMRLLSIVAICLAFSGEVVTMVSDLKTVQTPHSSSPSPVPTATASTQIFRRSFPDPFASLETPPPAWASTPVLVRREPTSLIGPTSTSPAPSTRRSSATSSRAITATNSPAPAADSTTTTSETHACAYIASTSIPTQPGGSLFSTLSRIFCCFILVAALVSEFSPPVTTRAGRLVERWWAYAFPPFGRDFGTGVLGAVQVFIGGTVLSHAVAKFTQVSGWFLFIVGILNLLCGLAFGSRLKVIRSPFADSTSPSALRKLRLESSSSHSLHAQYREDHLDDRPGVEHDISTRSDGRGGERLEAIAERVRANSSDRRKWYRFDNAPNVNDQHQGQDEEANIGIDRAHNASELSRKVRFTPSAVFGGGGGAGKGKSSSRNGPNGIVISAPMHLRGGASGEVGDQDVYEEMEQVRNGAGSTASVRAIGLPPPVYSGAH